MHAGINVIKKSRFFTKISAFLLAETYQLFFSFVCFSMKSVGTLFMLILLRVAFKTVKN